MGAAVGLRVLFRGFKNPEMATKLGQAPREAPGLAHRYSGKMLHDRSGDPTLTPHHLVAAPIGCIGSFALV